MSNIVISVETLYHSLARTKTITPHLQTTVDNFHVGERTYVRQSLLRALLPFLVADSDMGDMV